MTDKRFSQWRILAVVSALVLSALPKLVFGLGTDHPNDQPVGGSDKWPAGLKELVNRPERVHGYFVNWEDIFFFAGDTDKLAEFLKAYAKLPATKLKIVLHPGKPIVTSPWDKQPRDTAADWKLYTTPFTRADLEQAAAKHEKLDPGQFTTQLDVWTGGQIEFPRLFVIIPADIPVEAGDDAKGNAKIEKVVLKQRVKHAEADKLQRTKQQDERQTAEQEHTEWVAHALREMQTIKPGMARADLLKVFREEGGLSNAAQRRYAYRECPYNKVDVKFDAANDADGRVGRETPQDKIASISQPFLEWLIGD